MIWFVGIVVFDGFLVWCCFACFALVWLLWWLSGAFGVCCLGLAGCLFCVACGCFVFSRLFTVWLVDLFVLLIVLLRLYSLI